MTSNETWQSWERELIEQIAHGVRQAREAAGLSQRGLAEVAQISQGAVANVESGGNRVKQTPSIATIIRLAAALETPVAQLLYPDQPYGQVEVTPGLVLDSVDAADWLAGTITTSRIAGDRAERIRAGRELRRMDQQLSKLRLLIGLGVPHEPGESVDTDSAKEEFKRLRDERHALALEMLDRGWIEPERAKPWQLLKSSAAGSNE